MNFTKDHIQMIRQEHRNMEETRQIPQHLLEFINHHRLFKLFVPKIFDGKMLDLPSAVDIFQQASYIDGNFGWLVTIGAGGGMFAPNMTEDAAKACYSPPNAVIAGSGFPAGTAEPVENGYTINGKWFYCSGSQYATTFTVSCIVNNEKEEMLAFALDPGQVDVLQDWDAFGLKGTSSHSIQVKDQFVPKDRAFSVFGYQNDSSGAVHTFPFVIFSQASFAAISLGIGEHFLEAADELVENNKQNWKEGSNRYALLKDKLHEEKARLERANKEFHDILHSSWEEHIQSGNIREAVQQEFSMIAKRCATTSVYCANQLFRYIGMQMVMETHELNQIWRDLYTASQHTFLTPYDEAEGEPY